MSSLKGNHRPFVVDVVDEYNDDDDDDDDDDDEGNISHITPATPTNLNHNNITTTTTTTTHNNPQYPSQRSNANNHTKQHTISTTNTALTTFQNNNNQPNDNNNNNDEAPLLSSSSKSNKFKFWFLSENNNNNNNNNIDTSILTEDNNNNIINDSNEQSPQPVSSPFNDRNMGTSNSNINSNSSSGNRHHRNKHPSTALTVLPSPRNTNNTSNTTTTNNNTTAMVILPKNLVHETIHKQRNRLYQQLHDIEMRTSQLNADLAKEIMNFDTDVKQCMETKLIYNQSTIQQMDLYTFLNSDTTSTSTTTNTAINGNSATNTTILESDASKSSTPATVTTLQNMISSSSKNWMIYEQRISSLDAQMTHAVHVQLSDLNNEHIHQTIHDIVYTKIPKLVQDAQQYSTKNEQLLIQQWESIVGVMARRYAEERATRIVSYQTILDQIQSLQKQFLEETKKLTLIQQQQQQQQQQHDEDHHGNISSVDIATMAITDPNPNPVDHITSTTSNRDMVKVVPALTNETTTTTMYHLYQEIQYQIRKLQQQMIQEQEARYEQDEQLRALLLHRTEILQQAILETFE